MNQWIQTLCSQGNRGSGFHELLVTTLNSQYITLFYVCLCVCTQLYLTLWDPMDCSPSASSVHGISQARILKWVAVSFSRGSTQPRSLALASGFFTTEPPEKPNPSSSVQLSRSVMSNSLRPYGLQQARLLCPWDSPGKKVGVGYHFFSPNNMVAKIY